MASAAAVSARLAARARVVSVRAPLRRGPAPRPVYQRRAPITTAASSTSTSTTTTTSSRLPSPPPPSPPPPSPPPPPPTPSWIRRALSATSFAIVFTALGFAMAAAPAVSTANGLWNPPSDEETLQMYTPATEVESAVEAFIDSHPVVTELRTRPNFTESRPHLKMPEKLRSHTLTGGLLMGPGRIVVPPVTFAEDGGKSLVSISYLGEDLCGHPGIVHGGLLATMLDEGLARCCFPALPHKVGMTANLNINYRAPAMAGNYVALRATTTKVEGRKAWVEGRIETLVSEGETPVVLAEATALFVSPKQAAMMAGASPAS